MVCVDLCVCVCVLTSLSLLLVYCVCVCVSQRSYGSYAKPDRWKGIPYMGSTNERVSDPEVTPSKMLKA